MKIDVGNNTFLESDPMQFILKRYSGKLDKEGKETYKVLGYFSSLSTAVKHLLKLEALESAATTFEELLKEVREFEERIDSIIKI